MAEDLLPGAVRMTGDTIQEAEELLGMPTMGGSDLSGKEGGSDLSGKKQGGSGAAATRTTPSTFHARVEARRGG